MPHYYETVFVVEPSVEEEEAEKHLSRVKTVIEKKDGKILKVEHWGRRKLAYSIKHRKEGIYYLVEFEGSGEIVEQLERHYGLQEPILRHLTVARSNPSAEGELSPLSRLSEDEVEMEDVGEVTSEKPDLLAESLVEIQETPTEDASADADSSHEL